MAWSFAFICEHCDMIFFPNSKLIRIAGLKKAVSVLGADKIPSIPASRSELKSKRSSARRHDSGSRRPCVPILAAPTVVRSLGAQDVPARAALGVPGGTKRLHDRSALVAHQLLRKRIRKTPTRLRRGAPAVLLWSTCQAQETRMIQLSLETSKLFNDFGVEK